jgi:stage V sporulation protein R
MKDVLRKRSKWFEDKAREMGLDFFPINYEIVPEEVMLEIMSYGLPTRARHWSYGQSYQYQKLHGEMGMSKVYELVLNNDPSYAFLLDSNTDIANTMVIAHVIGHVHFFKNNHLFKKTDRGMVYHAAERAARIEEYIAKYGLERVENIMNIGFAIERNIDWHKGVFRDAYPDRKRVLVKRQIGEFDDLLGDDSPDYKEVLENENFPPIPERDILWFLINYANLEVWERDVLQIIREESFYFYPQFMTKIMNEGFASYIHAELMYLISDDILSPAEYIEFLKIHEKVVQPGRDFLNINPYFLGFTIFNDIKRKWDKLYEDGESEITGFQKILDVVEHEDDVSFLRNYLSEEVVEDLKMFAFRTYQDRKRDEYIEITSKEAEGITESIASDLYNYKAPLILVTGASQAGLELEHSSTEIGTLDIKHLDKVMGYLREIWGGVIDLKTCDENGRIIHFTYDELGFSDYPPNANDAIISP